MANLSIDIWSNNQYDALDESITSVKAGVSKMKKLYKEGKHQGLRMYVRDAIGGDTKQNRYYYFQEGKLKFDNDDY